MEFGSGAVGLSPQPVKRKARRDRVSLSCSVCRECKVKCDRGRPHCTRCEKHGCSDQCEYDPRADKKRTKSHRDDSVLGSRSEPAWKTSSEGNPATDQLKELKTRLGMLEQIVSNGPPTAMTPAMSLSPPSKAGTEPSSFASPPSIIELCSAHNLDPNERINFYEGYKSMMLHYSRMNNAGCLTWITLVRKDPFLKRIFVKVWGQQRHKLSLPRFMKPSTDSEGITSHDNLFKEQMIEMAGRPDMQPISNAPNKDRVERPMNEIILEALPNKKALRLYVDRFFKYGYPFLPYIDEPQLKGQIRQILGAIDPDTDSEEKFETLHLETKLDYAVVGQLLIAISIAQLSLRRNYTESPDCPPLNEDEKYLKEHSLGHKAIDTAQMCLNQFKLLRRCAFSVFQCMMLMRDYQKLGGCDGFGDEAPQIFLGMLAQIAVTIGLNRDPSQLGDDVAQNFKGALWRKIYYSLLFEDTYQAVLFGSPRMIRRKYFDTEMPEFLVAAANVQDLALEREAIQDIRNKFEFGKLLSDVSNIAIDMYGNHTVGELLEKTALVEDEMKIRWDCLQTLLTPATSDHVQNVHKVNAISLYCLGASLLHPVYYHLMLHYENIHNNQAALYMAYRALKYLREITVNFIALAKHSYRYVGPGFDFQLMPLLNTAVHKSIQLQLGLYLRCTGIQCYSNISLAYHGQLEAHKVALLTRNLGDPYLGGLKTLAQNYFAAWQLLKANTHIFKLLRKGQIPTPDKVYNFMAHLSPAEVNDLMSRTVLEDTTTTSNDESSHETPTELDAFWSSMFNRVHDRVYLQGGENLVNAESPQDTVWDAPYFDMFSAV